MVQIKRGRIKVPEASGKGAVSHPEALLRVLPFSIVLQEKSRKLVL